MHSPVHFLFSAQPAYTKYELSLLLYPTQTTSCVYPLTAAKSDLAALALVLGHRHTAAQLSFYTLRRSHAALTVSG